MMPKLALLFFFLNEAGKKKEERRKKKEVININFDSYNQHYDLKF